MGKRSVLASDSAPKRGKHAAASSPQDVPRSASDQQARRQAAGAATGERAPAAAAAAAPSSEQVLAEFDPVKWAQAESMPESLQQQFKQRLGEALKPSEDGCWSFVGPPMPKDAVLTHYRCDAPSGDNKRDGRRWPGVFHLDSKDLASLETAQDEVPLFHFEGLLMHDKDAGERWEVTLGDCVIIPERKKQGSSTVVEEMVGRVTDIFVTVKGERYVRVHWMYRAVDTPLAAGPKESNGTKKEQGEQHVAQLPIGDCLVHPRMLRVCGSDEDNQRYNTHYKLAEIDRKTRVVHIKPGYKHPTEDPSFEGEFDDQQDWFYNSYTHTDHFMFADCFEDYTLFGPHYKQLWQAKGVAGIRALLPRLKIPASLMRGLSGKKLVLVQLGEGKRVLYVLELFCGGGGLAYLAQFNGKVAIKHGWANDINNSASATYTCNHPEAFMSCVGLEELTQLCMKWGLDVVRCCGSGWMQIPELQQLRSGGPQRKFARTHIPQGVGVWGTTMGKAGTSSDGHTAAAARGEKAVREYRAQQCLPPPVFGAAEDEQQQQQQPDFEVICKRLPKISPADSSDAPSVGDFMPRLTELEEEEDGGAAAAAAGSSAAAARAKAKKDKEKQRMQEAYEQARQQQQQCIDECVAFNKQHGRGKVLEVRDVRIKDCAVRVKQGSSRNQIEEGLTDWECWLEYEVRRERTGASSSSSSSDDSSEWAWEHQALLWRPDGVAPMQRFMLAMLADKQIPMPGDVGVLTGGPPCQNVSGLNRHAKQQEILNDPKNRLVTAYMKLIGYLQPSFIFMEQVCDVWRKENATYARYAMTLMVGSGYQAHAAICVAGEYGVPQGRMRAMFWGAASGKEQLPPFPAPTHRCLPFNQDFPLSGAACRAGFPKGEAGLHPWTLMGDVLTDLPAVSNYEEGDRQHYASDPQSVAQAWLRRTPPGYSRSLPERCIYAGAAMEPWQQMQQRAPEMLAQSESEDKLAMTLAVGARLLCKGKGSISLADLTGPSAAAAAGPSDGAGSSSAAAAAGAKQQGKQPSAGKKGAGKKGAAAAADEVAASDEGGDAADDEDTAELAAEMQGGSHFATQTWLKHLNSIEDPIARQILHLQRAAELHNTQYVRGQQKLHMDAAAAQVDAAAPLRDHRPLMCNEDDYRRMCAVPKEKGANFRDMPGVVTHPGAAGSKSGRGTCCSGSWHAEQRTVDSAANKALLAANLAAWRALSEEERGKKDDMAFLFRGVEMECGCPGGGMPPKPPKGFQGSDGNHKSFRVDSYGSTANGAWRGSKLEGCSSVTYFTNTGDLVCPRWCVTYKGGASNGRHGCFGRIWWDQIQPTVVTRAEPHNLELVHPTQDRVLSIRENARCQGFPDYHVFVGLAGGKGRNGSHGKGTATVDERYMQIGNAVAPPLAAALGRCLLLAATEDAPVGVPVVSVPDPEYEAVLQECRQQGIKFWCEQEGNVVDESPNNDFYWARHLGPSFQRTAKGRAKKGAAQQQLEEEEETGDAAAAGAAPAAAAAAAVAAGAASGGSKGAARKGSSKQQKNKASSSAADGAAAAAAAGSVAAAAAAEDAPASKRKNSAGAAAGSSKAAAAAAAGSGKAAAAGSGRSSKRSAAAAATAAIREGLQQEATPIKKLAQQAAAAAAAAQKAQQGSQAAAAAAAAAAEQLQQQQQQVMADAGPEESPAAAAPAAAAGAEPGESSARSSADLVGTDSAAEEEEEQQQQKQQQQGSSGEEDEEMEDADELVALPVVV